MTTLVLQPDPSTGKDSEISSNVLQNNRNYGVTVALLCGEREGESSVWRSFIQFDLSSIPVTATISSATLELYEYGEEAANDRTLRIYRMKQSWLEGTGDNTITGDGITWKTYNGVNLWPGGAGGFGASDCEQTDIGSRDFSATEAVGWKSFDLTASKVQEWINGTFDNNGMMIKADTEVDDTQKFRSSDFLANPSERPKLTIVYVALPNAPTNLTATAVTSTRIDLTWDDNADNETGFSIERSINGIDFAQIDTVGADVESYSDVTCNPNTHYWYRVRAYNDDGDSDYSNIADDTTPPAPGGASADNFAVIFVAPKIF